MSFTGFGSSLMTINRRLNPGASGRVKRLTREDEPSMSLEDFAFMADDMVMWNDNERVLA
jgi:hypothetical protein